MMFTTQINGQKVKYTSYATTKEYIIGKVQKKYKNGSDVAKSLRDEKVFNLATIKPKRSVSTKDDKEGEVEQGGFDIEYQEELRRYLDRMDMLEENMKKAYTMIFTNYCTKGMQQRVKEHPNFKGEIEDDPIKLLISIKSLTHEPVRAQYPLIAVTDSFIRWINGRQYDDKDLVNYVKRFKQQQRDIVKSQLGKDFLHDFF